MFEKVGNRKVASDEGFSIELLGRHDLVYQEHGKSLKFYVEDWKPKADILVDTNGVKTIGQMETSVTLSPQDMLRIVSNITGALNFLGLSVCVHEPTAHGKQGGPALEQVVVLVPVRPKRLAKRIWAGVVSVLVLTYIGDSLWFRVRLIHPKPADPLESFTGPRVLAIPEKGNKTSYEIDQQNPEQTVTCAHSWFPHSGYRPCWYVKPRLNQPIPM